MASIDAPELGRCLSQDSKEVLSKLILRKRVVLLEPYADEFGRIIALVLSDGQIINEIMVRNGYAVDTYDNFSAKKALPLKAGYTRSGDCQTELKM